MSEEQILAHTKLVVTTIRAMSEMAVAAIHATGDVVAAALHEAKKFLVIMAVLLMTAVGLWTFIVQKLQ